jgi:transcriptional regulator with XRE-family HTH domain
MSEAGRLLKKQRLKNKWTRRQVENMFNLAPGSMQQLETGNVEEIGVRLYGRICLRLGLEFHLTEIKLPTLQELYEEAEKEKAKILRKNSIKINKLF